jgi:hypothetical protein
MNRRQLSRQDTLVESSVARAQHRPAVRADLGGEAQARRPDVPGIKRAQPGDDPVGLAACNVARVDILTDGSRMIEPQAGIDRDPIAHGQRVAGKGGRRDELATIDGGDAGHGLKRLPVAIDKPRAGWNDQSLTVLADLHLPANLPLVIGRKQPSLIMTQRRLRCRANEG